MIEATWDVIEEQGGKRPGGVFWILHVDMGGGVSVSGLVTTQVILSTAETRSALECLCMCRET